MKRNPYILLTLLVFISSCTNFSSGKFITTKVSPEDKTLKTTLYSYDEQVYQQLKQKLTGRKYEVQFHSNFATMTDLTENEETVFSKEQNEQGTYYVADVSKGKNKENFKLELWPDGPDKLIFVVYVHYLSSQYSYIPAQIGGSVQWRSGVTAVCYLSKYD